MVHFSEIGAVYRANGHVGTKRLESKMKPFRNEEKLKGQKNHDCRDFDLSLFPLIEDLIVVPIFGQIPGWDIRQPHLVGARLYSESIGYLAGHQWWEQIFGLNKVEGAFSTQDIPKGTIRNPHWDFQPGWHIVVFEHEDFVYVLQADDDQSDEFPTWFRVSSTNYSRAWLKALQ